MKIAINLWYRNSFDNNNYPGTKFTVTLYEKIAGTIVWSTTSVITQNENVLSYSALVNPVTLKENIDYILRVQFVSGYPTKLGYWIEHVY